MGTKAHEWIANFQQAKTIKLKMTVKRHACLCATLSPPLPQVANRLTEAEGHQEKKTNQPVYGLMVCRVMLCIGAVFVPMGVLV